MDLDLVEGVREGLREAHELFSDGIFDAAEWQEEVRPSRSPRAPEIWDQLLSREGLEMDSVLFSEMPRKKRCNALAFPLNHCHPR
jgi:hypothetical protein